MQRGGSWHQDLPWLLCVDCATIGYWISNVLLMQDLPADLVLWTAGSAPSTQTSQNPLKLPFPADKRGSTQTDATLRVQGHSNVFALGDVATPSMAEPLPNTAQVGDWPASHCRSCSRCCAADKV